MDFGREKEVFPLVLIQVKSAAKRTVFDLKNKREKTFLPFKTQLFHIQVVRYAASAMTLLFMTVSLGVHTSAGVPPHAETINPMGTLSFCCKRLPKK